MRSEGSSEADGGDTSRGAGMSPVSRAVAMTSLLKAMSSGIVAFQNDVGANARTKGPVAIAVVLGDGFTPIPGRVGAGVLTP